MTTFTPAFVSQMRADLQPKIDALIKEMYPELTGRLGNATLSAKRTTFKLEIKAPGVDPAVLELAKQMDYPEIGTAFQAGKDSFEVVDYNLKKIRPIVCERITPGSTKARFEFTPNGVKTAVKISKPF